MQSIGRIHFSIERASAVGPWEAPSPGAKPDSLAGQSTGGVSSPLG